MEGIQQMFSEFMGYDEYETQLTLWAYRRRANVRTAEAQAEWHRLNPQYTAQRWQTVKADTAKCRRCKEPPAPDSALCKDHLQWDRDRVAARRAAKKQQESRAA